ncbi:AB22G-like protein [Mya arenaria]|uniref:AB22G-like protein n=1 Tax=Mya arenaria TaxID=6604 RepID=A0ABY7DXJ3_MYAAR|nr:AB22G-like protein [Mya arenaria]
MFWACLLPLADFLSVPTERGVISKERAAGAYRLSAYYFAKIVSELPLTIVVPSLFYTVVYWMSGLGNVGQFFASLSGLGMLIGAVFTNLKVALLFANTFLFSSLLFSGFITVTYPWWLTWARYVSHIQYPLSAITMIRLQGKEPILCTSPSVSQYAICLHDINATVTSSDILKENGIVLPLHCYISTLACVFVILRVIVYIVLRLPRP